MFSHIVFHVFIYINKYLNFFHHPALFYLKETDESILIFSKKEYNRQTVSDCHGLVSKRSDGRRLSGGIVLHHFLGKETKAV